MKKIFVVSSAFFVLLVLQSLMIMKKDGAAPGYTGSPGDSFKNCTACHGGIATTVDGWISSDIPAEGYVPGATYTVTATNSEAGATRFGFEVSPQDSSGNLMGSMRITDPVRTKFVGGEKYITYTENGVESVNSASWSFKWVAPQSLTDVTFYGGFNSNFEGHKDGDHTYLSTLTVKRNKALDIGETADLKSINVFPNPTCDYLSLAFKTEVPGTLQADITDVQGKLVRSLINGQPVTGIFEKRFDISGLAAGQYMVRLQINGKQSVHHLSIAR